MENQENKIIILPAEVSELAVKVSANKQAEVQNVLQQIFVGTADWERQVDAIEVKNIADKMSIELADVARRNAKTARISAEKIFDAKRAEVQQMKLYYDLEDKLWLKAKQVMQIKFKAIEEKAEWKANFVKRYEAEQKELKTQSRILEVAKYAEINRIEFENMSNATFESFLNGLKQDYEEQIEFERAEAERRQREWEAEIKKQKAIEAENAFLKAEAEKREKEIEAERKANEERLAKERAIAKAEAERVAAENKAKFEAQQAEIRKAEAEQAEKLRAEREAKEKIERELKAKQAAEMKAEQDRKEAELKAQKEAEKLAKAPIKKQLTVWVDSFNIVGSPTINETSTLIEAKFNAFKRWAKNEIETI